jgi:hypothetical protein
MLRTKRVTEDEVFLADRPDFYKGHELDWLAANIGYSVIPGRECGPVWDISNARRHVSGKRSEAYQKLHDQETLSLVKSQISPDILSWGTPLFSENTHIRKLSVDHGNVPLLSGFRVHRCGGNQPPDDCQLSDNLHQIRLDPAMLATLKVQPQESQAKRLAQEYRPGLRFSAEK